MAFLRLKRIELRVIKTFIVNMFLTVNSRQDSSMIAILKTLFRTNPLAIGNLFAMKNGNLTQFRFDTYKANGMDLRIYAQGRFRIKTPVSLEVI